MPTPKSATETAKTAFGWTAGINNMKSDVKSDMTSYATSHAISNVTSGVKYGSRNKQVGNKQIQHPTQCKIWRWKQHQGSREKTNLIGNPTGMTLKYSQGEMRRKIWG